MKQIFALFFAFFSLLCAQYQAIDSTSVVQIQNVLQNELNRNLAEFKKISSDTIYYSKVNLWWIDSFEADASSLGLERSEYKRQPLMALELRMGNPNFDQSQTQGSSETRSMIYAPVPTSLDTNLLKHALWALFFNKSREATEAYSKKKMQEQDSLESIRLQFRMPPQMSKSDFHTYKWSDSALIHNKLTRAALELNDSNLIENRIGFRQYFSHWLSVDQMQNKISQTFGENTLLGAALVQTDQGEPVWGGFSFSHPDQIEQAISWDSLILASRHLQKELLELRTAPVIESYRGPILFEKQATGAFFENVLVESLRKKGSESDNNELDKLLNKKVFPSFLQATDNPNLPEFLKRKLYGHYLFDHEGIAPTPVYIIQNGIYKEFYQGLKCIHPDTALAFSNGHYRYNQPWIGVLKVWSSEAVTEKKLEEKARLSAISEGNEYALVIDQFHIPEAFELLRHPLTETLLAQQKSGESGFYFPPILRMYKLDVSTSKRTLVRSRGLNSIDTRSLRSILAMGDQFYLYEPKASASYLTPHFLMELMDVQNNTVDWPKKQNLYFNLGRSELAK